MSQDITPKLREIFSRLNTEVKGVDFMMGDYVLDSYIPERDANGLFKPYALCKIHTAYETADNGICEKDKDPLEGSFSFYVVTPDGWITQETVDAIRAALRGKRFTDTGPLKASGGYSFSDSDLGFIRYVQNIGFTFMYNLGG